jgi:hypothetical protein
MEAKKFFNEDWKVLARFFPQGWKAQAKQLGALTRQRGVKSINILLRLLLIHLADGCSLRETVARAKQGKLCELTDVALLKRLRVSSEWFRWMSLELLKRKGINITVPSWLNSYGVKSIDASVITEPGSTGTDWRLHYSINIFSLNCEQFIITRPKTGESFTNFQIKPRDLLIGDRAYGRLKGLCYVKENKGEFIARLMNKAFPILKNGREFSMIEAFERLDYGEIGEWDVEGSTKGGLKLPLRLCVIKKSKEEAEKSIKKAKRAASKGRRKIEPGTLELHRYIILVTSLPKEISAKLILELYRFRWQIEIAFKRLKSILGLGHLPKIDKESCRAWLHGKIFVALLAQSIVDEGRHFFPWGYPI